MIVPTVCADDQFGNSGDRDGGYGVSAPTQPDFPLTYLTSEDTRCKAVPVGSRDPAPLPLSLPLPLRAAGFLWLCCAVLLHEG